MDGPAERTGTDHDDEKSSGDDPPKLPALSYSNEQGKFPSNEIFPGSIKKEYDNVLKGAGRYGNDGGCCRQPCQINGK
jgi:hypothetical protein